MTTRLKLGKKKAAPDKRDLKFSAYFDATQLPDIPSTFGLDSVVPRSAWGMLGNDNYGDCVWAGADHEHIMWGARGAGMPAFNPSNALADYAACTGFNPKKPNTDQGTDVHDAMKYRQKIGVVDAFGKRHKIGAYVALDPKNLTEIWQALYVCEAVALGIEFPASAMDQFDAGEPWSVVDGSEIEGGHYIPILSKQGKNTIKVVTWGTLQTVTQEFLTTYADEVWGLISTDSLNAKGKSFRGFSYADLESDLAAIAKARTKAEKPATKTPEAAA